jgi:hypothetical protein
MLLKQLARIQAEISAMDTVTLVSARRRMGIGNGFAPCIRFTPLALLLLFLALFALSQPAPAASNYSQNFTSGAPNWQVLPGQTWTVTDGYYANTFTSAERVISYYGGDTWTSDYTYKASVFSDFEASGNRVGVVFNYVDEDNYYEVDINMGGEIWLNHMSSGSRLQLGYVQAPAAVPGKDIFFDVTIIRTGNNVTVKIGTTTVFTSVALPASPAGRIGVFCRFNQCRFDNVDVTLAATDTYSQNFTSGAPNWQVLPGQTWAVTSGYYANTFTSAERVISWYAGDSWTTGYTYKASVFSDFEASGNRVGVVFNYVDEDNYYDVDINMQGEIWLNHMSGGSRLQLGYVQVPAAVPGKDTFFDVTIIRSGNHVTVQVGTTTVFNNVALPASPDGNIGVFCRFNQCRFDNVNVTLGSTPPASPPPLFRSGFQSGVTLTTPVCKGTSWFFDIDGTDSATGHSWMPTIWGPPGVEAFNTAAPCASPLTDYLVVTFKNVTGPTGTTTRVLSDTVKNADERPDNGLIARGGISYSPESSQNTTPNRFYIRRYLKYSANLATAMGTHDWFVQHEYKARDCTLPRRLLLYWRTDGNAVKYYNLRMDKANNCSVEDPFEIIMDQKCFPTQGGSCPQFPIGEWFYDEWFVQWSPAGTAQDRVAYAVNGQVIFDRREPLITPQPKTIKLTPGYLNVKDIEIQTDDFEIHSNIPCASFPCGPPPHN